MPKIAAALMLVLMLVLWLAGCSKTDDGPACEKVVDNMITVTKQQMTGHGDMELTNRKAMLAQCEQRKLSADQRRCLASVKDLAGLAACTSTGRPPAQPHAPATP